MAKKQATRLWFMISLGSTIGVTFFLARPMGVIPALAPLLNPSSGIWLHHIPEWKNQKVRGLKTGVQVAIDRHGVFHIFAQNDPDLYLAQGYLTARYRLFQMDMSTRVAEGRLSELVGPGGAGWDRYFVQFGMRDYSRATLKKALSRESTKLAMESYVAGVNQWIENLRDDTLPPEYKILGTWPEKFELGRASNLLILMAYNLAGRSFDLEQTQLRLKHGVEKARQLFPEFLPENLESYIVNNALPRGRDMRLSPWVGLDPHVKNLPATYQPDSGNGSNNFAVTAAKSATGSVILADDTHLGYSLPNVWVENHLVTPDLNVYGVSFPMGAGVVLGFNRSTAWGVTNGTTDVLDWFEVEFKDEKSLEYKYGEQWKTAELKRESFKVKGQTKRHVDVLVTDFGYVMQREGKWGIAAKWSGGRMGDEFHGLMEIARGKNFQDCVKALDFWFAPVQNWICADARNVGIFHRGWIPVRATGEGQFVETARPEAWQKGIPFDELPHAVNPQEGFVRSANQRVVGRDYKYYMGWDYEDPARGMEIKRKLSGKAKISSQDLMDLQNDIYDVTGAQAIPLLIKNLQMERLSPVQQQAVETLSRWDYLAKKESVEITLYKEWWRQLRKAVVPGFMYRPRLQWMLERLDKNPKDEDSFWLKDLKAAVTESFLKSWEYLSHEYGEDFRAWNFSKMNKTQFPHLTHMPGFGVTDLPTDGTALSPQANRGEHGPVYRLVVELGETPQAWTMVPGGNEGDPFSGEYGRFLAEWSKGEMKKVYFWQTWAEAVKEADKIFTLEPQ